MSQPDISPLARRLAEENNVDWRGLHGSGAGGKVVERDVLEYLARVMAGEEDLDPTPEPLPEGMDAWPSADVSSFQNEMQASTNGVGLQQIRQELSASERQEGVEEEPEVVADAGTAVEEAGGESGEVISEDIFLFDDDEEAPDLAPPTGPELPEVDAPAGSGFSAGEDSLLVGDADASWSAALEDDAADAEDVLWSGAAPSAGAESGGDDLPDIFGSAPSGDTDVTAEPAGGPELPEEGPEVPEETATGDEAAEPYSADAVEEAEQSEPEVVAPVAEVAAPSTAESSGAAEALPLVSYGTLLRRHVDVTALAGAQLAVGLEMGESEPLSPASFLLRAAAKAVSEGAWGDGSVAMVALTPDGIRVGDVHGAAERPFVELTRSLGAELAQATEQDTSASLAVADMSALEVDEAVLRLQAPLLTLGRILYDNQHGSYRSTLSLSGEVAPEQGARLLARVAELLDAPVRLLL